MFSFAWVWLLTLLGRDPRGMFRYWDGRRWRAVDPLETLRKFFTLPGYDWDETPELLRSSTATVQLEGIRAIAQAVRTVFDVPAVDRGGLTETGCLDLLTDFRLFMGDVKKNGSLWPTLPQPTESVPLADLPIPAKPGAGYGSTSIGPSPAPHGSPAVPTPSA